MNMLLVLVHATRHTIEVCYSLSDFFNGIRRTRVIKKELATSVKLSPDICSKGGFLLKKSRDF